MGLDETFSTIKSQSLAMKLLCGITEDYRMVLNNEQMRSVTIQRRPQSEASSFQAKGERRSTTSRPPSVGQGNVMPMDTTIALIERNQVT
ncbi:unnamed protein product [Linum trigynum]|uniref:Uncharacterized protein n=1 Tax=Linum trigynum TaxID=586398 RepID=A0AAV2CLC5_9ROSI